MTGARGNDFSRGTDEGPSAEELAGQVSLLRARLERQEELSSLQAEVFERAGRAQDARAQAVRHTIAFRLGQALLQGFSSLDGLRKLPGQLLELNREIKARRHLPSGMGVPEVGKAQARKAMEAYKEGGFAAVDLLSEGRDAAVRAGTYAALFHRLTGQDVGAAAQAARLACADLSSPDSRRWLGARLLECGCLSEGVEVIRALGPDASLSATDVMRTESAEGLLRLQRKRPDLSGPARPDYSVDPEAMLYVAASSRPFHHTGYTLRTHSIVTALAQRGRKITVLTRPGYPWDRFDVVDQPGQSETVIDGIIYRHMRIPFNTLPLDIYAELGADAIAREARTLGVGVIHAASNHVNALPALLAARRLGLPFHYEMRGIWELSRASKVPGFEHTEAFALATGLEGFVAANADRLFVISEQLGDYAVEHWGIDPARITLMPNGVDEAIFAPAREEAPKSFTIAYAGAIVPYEGLDLLIEALVMLAGRGEKVKLVVMGEGESRVSLERLAARAGVGAQVEFLGRVAQGEAQRRLREASLVCIPRRADRVCEIIPPLKLHEAMALGLPVLVPDLAVFRSEVEEGVTGLFFQAGNASDLASRIEEASRDRARLAAIGQAARSRTKEMRTWPAILDRCAL